MTPVGELAESYESWLARQTDAKGRAPLFPYIGSGIGHGPLVQLSDGSVKWDMINGIGVHMFGHGDLDLVGTALRGAIADTVMQGNLQFNTEVIEFGELLAGEAARGSNLKHAFLINSGALANESALKVCFQKNAPADRVLAFSGAFAGRTMAMVQIGDSAAGRIGLPHDLAVDYVPFYDPRDGEASIAESLNTLDELRGGSGIWLFSLRVRSILLPAGEAPIEIQLRTGFNLVAWFGPAVEPAEAAASLGGAVDSISRWNPRQEAFETWGPRRPDALNTLDLLRSGDGVWVEVDRDVIWKQR